MGTYGAHRIKCHSAFQHYNMFHGHSTGGNNYGSIFNINVYDGGGCGGGGFWSGLGAGFGAGFGNMFGGFLSSMFGGFGNMFGGCFGGGFGMGGLFGGFGNMFGGFGGFGNMFGGGFGLGGMLGYGLGNTLLGGGISGLFGGKNKKAKKSKETKETDKPETTTVKDKKCEDKDGKKITDYIKEIRELKDTDTAKALKLYKELSKLAKNPEDTSHETDNKKSYEELLLNLKKQFDFTSPDDDGNPTEAKAKTSTPDLGNIGGRGNPVEAGDPGGAGNAGGNGSVTTVTSATEPWTSVESWNEFDPNSIPKITGKNNYTNGSDAEVTSENFETVEDTHGTRNVQGGVKISNTKHGNTKFPEYISITDNNNGQTYSYRCAGVRTSGYAVYTTPSSDTNENVYILLYDPVTKTFKLSQKDFAKGDYGAGVRDKQNG